MAKITGNLNIGKNGSRKNRKGKEEEERKVEEKLDLAKSMEKEEKQAAKKQLNYNFIKPDFKLIIQYFSSNQKIMKRALALLEQTKNTMPHLPRPASRDEQETEIASKDQASSIKYAKNQKRAPSASGRSNTQDSGSQKLMSNATEMSSRKSTAVSSTTRIGSSGTQNKSTKRPSYLASTGGAIQASDIIEKASVAAPYELSLKQGSKAGAQKPPHKLKPLLNKTSSNNTATSILEIENAYQKEMMKEIDADLNEYLDTNKILSQMQTAFGGDSVQSQPKPSKKTSQKSGKPTALLDPILEEGMDNQQLIPYQGNQSLQEQRAKKNELLKSKVKKLTGGSSQSSVKEGPLALPQSETADTFITGTKIAAQPDEDEHIIREYESRMQERKKKKHYKYEEDELLDDLNQHERDMNEMLKYLSEVEELIKGQDLKSIQQMMDVTKETMNQHFEAYDKFKGQIQDLDTQADEAIRILNFYDTESGKKQEGNNKKNYQLEKIFERNNEEDKEAEALSKKNKPSHEHQKSKIVTQLVSMNQSMREFSSDLESRLDKAYKAGASKKFGYDSITSTSSSMALQEDNRKEDRTLNKLHSQAQQYIEQSNASALLKIGSGQSATNAIAPRLNSSSNKAVKALPMSDTLKRKSSFKGATAKAKKPNDDLSVV